MAQGNSYVRRKFGYTKVKWVIENYCVTPEGEDGITFHSSDIYVRGFHLTRWKMIIKRSFVDTNHYSVFFYLYRLKCFPYTDPVMVDCVLEYTDHHKQIIEDDFRSTFDVNLMNFQEVRLFQSGITPIGTYHLNTFRLTCHILVHFDKIMESVPPCHDLGLRSLSEDIRQLYEDGVLSDIRIQFASKNDPLFLHKPVLLLRIGNKDIKRDIAAANGTLDLTDFHYEPAEKVCKFLYSGDINYPVTFPSISVYKFAKVFDVKPVVAYYKPDRTYFTSTIEVEECSTKWTIHKFGQRNESFLLSRLMTNNNMDTRWRLKVYPKGFENDSEYVYVCLNIETETLKHICVQIFLVDNHKNVCHSFHKSVISSEILIVENFVAVDYATNNFNQKLEIGLQLRISTGEDSCSIEKNTSGDYYFYGQKNYERLSEDILSIYQNQQFNKMCIDFIDHNVKIHLHEGIVYERCVTLLHVLKNNNLNPFTNVEHAVLFELFSFLYSGKLGRRISLEEIFSLYQLARDFNFNSLKAVIIKTLKESLSDSNARAIYRFAEFQEIESLGNFVWDFWYFENYWFV